MTELDPIARAEILARFGRVHEAIASLEASLKSDPNRQDVLAKLKELRADEAASRLARNTAPVHIAVGWALYTGSMVLMFLPVWWLARLLPNEPFAEASGGQVAAFAAAGVVYIVAAVWLSLAVFHRAWLLYLMRLPLEQRASAEASLQRSMAPSVFGARYEALRAKAMNDA